MQFCGLKILEAFVYIKTFLRVSYIEMDLPVKTL